MFKKHFARISSTFQLVQDVQHFQKMEAISPWIACPKFSLPRESLVLRFYEARQVENNGCDVPDVSRNIMFEAMYIVFNSGVSTFGRYMNIYTYISYLLKHDVVRNRFQEPAMFFVWEHLFLTSTLLKFGYFVLSVLWGSLLRMHAYYFHMFCIRTLAPVRLIVCFITSTHNFRCFSISQMVCILIFLTCDWSCFVCCSVTCPRLANS